MGVRISLGLDKCFGQTARSTYIFITKLVHGEVDCAVGPASYFLLDCVLVDEMMGPAVRVVVCVFGACIQGFLGLEMAPISNEVSMHPFLTEIWGLVHAP